MVVTKPKVPNTSIKALLDWAKHRIAKQQDLTFQSPALEARLLFTHACHKNHAWIITHSNDLTDDAITTADLKYFVELVAERIRGKPIAFIIGTQAFWTLLLKVSDCTLIPRQDTETLVETVLSLPIIDNANVLDLGTGTGAIALALAKEKPQWQITGLDSVAEAVELAKENAQLNDLKARFVQSDWFSALNNSDYSQKFDLIVTNPPYVEEDSDYIRQGDLRFEPLSALVSGKDGLDDIRVIISQSTAHLNNCAYLVIEHGGQQYKNVQALFCAAGFTKVKSIEDLNHIPRITLGLWP